MSAKAWRNAIGLALFAGAPLAVGCSEHAATQVIVQIYVDSELATDAKSLHVSIENDEGTTVFTRDKPLTGNTGRIARIPLIPKSGDPTRRFIVHAELYDAAKTELVRLEARGGYTSDELRSLNLQFTSECRGKTCESGRTCQGGVCRGDCFQTGAAESNQPNLPSCGECELCASSCEPADGAACGCPGEACAAKECVPSESLSFVGASFVHTCAASQTGAVYCWGTPIGGHGQLGLGDGVASFTPARVPGIAATEGLAVTGNFTCALETDHRWCWGENDVGQLGSGITSVDELTPLDIDNSSPKLFAVHGGFLHMCGFEQDRIWCWGANNEGQLGNGTISPVGVPTPVEVGSGGYSNFSVGGQHSCGVRTDGDLDCWGQNKSLQLGVSDGLIVPQPVSPGCPGKKCFHDWTRVACGGWHTCAIREGGHLYCWGANRNGQLGIGPGLATDDVLEPQAVASSIEFAEIAAGSHYTCGLDKKAALYCWGDNVKRQLGIPDVDVVYEPTRVDVYAPNGWRSLSLGNEHTCAIRQDRTLWCWGDNSSGQIGNGSQSDTVPVPHPTRVCF